MTLANKATVRITGVKGIGNNLKKIARLAVEEKTHLDQLAIVVQKSIVGNARLGRDPNGEKFKELTESTIERKAKLAKVNETSDFYRKRKSNLTFTGQLLNSFKYKITQSTLTIQFFFEGFRKPYKGLRKEALETLATNKLLAAKLEKDRPFSFISDKTKDVLVNLIRRKIRQQLTNFRKLNRLLR